jgi:hypothetical protein
MPMISENPWYVMFGSHPRRPSKQTIEYFRTEDAAREFARNVLNDGYATRAGTTPGVEPTKVVRPAEIAVWCAKTPIS